MPKQPDIKLAFFRDLVPLKLAGDGGLPLVQEGVVIVPDGRSPNFNGKPLILTAKNAAKIVAEFKARGVDLPIDLEHSAIEAAARRELGKSVDPTPAFGWIKKLAYVKGRGLVGEVHWLEEAADLIEAEKYKYLSPLIWEHKKSGEVVGLLGAGLTNTPAIDNMEALIAASRNLLKGFAMPEDTGSALTSPDQIAGEIKMLLIQQGVELGDDADLTAILNAVKAHLMAGASGADDGDDGADEGGEVAAATLKAIGKIVKCSVDATPEVITEAVSKIVTGKTGTDAEEKIKALSTQVLDLTTKDRARDATDIVAAAVGAGKFKSDDKDAVEFWTGEAMADPEKTKKVLGFMPDTRPPQDRIVPMSTTPAAGSGSAEQKMIDDAMKEHDGNVRAAYTAMQGSLLKTLDDQGFKRDYAIGVLKEQYPKIFA